MVLNQLLRFFSNRASLVGTGLGAHQTSTMSHAARASVRGLPWPWKPRLAASHPALEEAKDNFAQALSDIDCREACCLTMRIRYAHSMQALWHFRSNVFLLVSLHHSQREAHARLEQLNQHFPTRSPRSGFAALID